MAQQTLRVMAVDDDATVLRAYRDFFAGTAGHHLVGVATDGADAEAVYAECQPDVVLMDLQMPRLSGIDATRALCTRWPRACVVAMTTFGTRQHVVAALRAGASGYLIKGVTGPQLLSALRQAVAGDMPLSSVVRRQLVGTVLSEPIDPLEEAEHGLTPREVELVEWIAHGLTNRQIATRMGISEGSVKQYVARCCDKLEVVSRTQLLVRVIQLGIVDPAAIPVR